MAPKEDNAFTYDGHLIFHPYSTTIRSENEGQTNISKSLSESLPEYSDSNTEKNKGFKKIHLDEHYRNRDFSRELDPSSIIALQFIREEIQSTEAYYDGKRVEVEIPERHSADIYWHYPDYMFFRGAQIDVKEAQSSIRSALFQYVRIENIGFEPDFLLWLFYNYFSSLDNNLIDILRITNVGLEGSHDLFGAENLVRDSVDAARSVPILLGLLQNKSITSLEADFNHNGDQIRAEIKRGKVLLKASKGVMTSATDLNRIMTALEFMRNIVKTFKKWQHLAPSQKYPPLDFFKELYDVCKEQGIRIDSPSTEPLREYAAKRGEEPSDYGFNL